MSAKKKPSPPKTSKSELMLVKGGRVSVVSVSGPPRLLNPPKGRQPRYPIMPNPFPPDDILGLLKLAGSAATVAAPVFYLIKVWLDGRANRRIKIKKGDAEIELQGMISKRDLERAFSSFRRLAKTSEEEEIKVIENGKVVTKADKADYLVTETDIQASREIEHARVLKKVSKKKGRKK